MDFLQTKRKLIDTIQTTHDESLLVELMDVVEQHPVVINLSEKQKAILQERISRVEEGDATYYNAREEAAKIKKKLDEL